uniref:Protein kinase domain-containing protein n=1 Tax=Panagrolaimus sp. ES5 TaxID=591445 RepID=A0AC34GNS4_9BILA
MKGYITITFYSAVISFTLSFASAKIIRKLSKEGNQKRNVKITVTSEKKDQGECVSLNGKKYLYIKKLGEGGFGEVHLAKERSTKREFAIKFIDTKKMNIPTLGGREAHSMKSLNHKNIIKLYAAVENGDLIYLVMEYAAGGDLHDYILKNYITGRNAKRFFHQIVTGVAYLHSKKFAHRDLKPQNILLDSNGDIKIADFGLSKAAERGDNKMFTRSGTPGYSAPEVNCITVCGYDGFKADMYSLGIILHAIVTNYKRTKMPSESVLLFKKLTCYIPSFRPSANEVLEDQWLLSFKL